MGASAQSVKSKIQTKNMLWLKLIKYRCTRGGKEMYGKKTGGGGTFPCLHFHLSNYKSSQVTGGITYFFNFYKH